MSRTNTHTFPLEEFQCVTKLYLSRRDCYENNGLYHALQLETMFNINSFLNRTVVSLSLLCRNCC